MNSSLKTQSALLFLAKSISFLSAFALPLLVVRFLSKGEIGTYRQAFLIVANASAILPFGLPITALYFLPREPENRNQAIQNILLFSFLTGAVFFLLLLCFPDLLVRILTNENLEPLAPLIGITVWLWVFSSSLEFIAIANQETRIATLFIIISQLTKTSLMILALVLFASVKAMLYAAIVQGLLQTFALILYLKRRFKLLGEKPSFTFLRRHLEYAIPLGFSGLLWILQNDLHNYFVSYHFGAEKFAIYAYGCFQIPLVMILRESVASVLIPKISQLQAHGDKAEIVRLTTKSMQKLALFYFPIYVFLLITADVFIVTLFTEKFDASVPIFLVNLTLLPLEILLIDPIIRAYKELGNLLLKVRVISITTLIFVLYTAIQHLELTQIITIVVLLSLTEKLFFALIVAKRIDFRREHIKLLLPITKTALSCLISGVALFFFVSYAGEILLPFFAKILSPFLAGLSFLLVCLLIFSTLFVIFSNFFHLLDEEKEILRGFLKRRILS